MAKEAKLELALSIENNVILVHDVITEITMLQKLFNMRCFGFFGRISHLIMLK
jgi:hypothetical protein